MHSYAVEELPIPQDGGALHISKMIQLDQQQKTGEASAAAKAKAQIQEFANGTEEGTVDGEAPTEDSGDTNSDTPSEEATDTGEAGADNTKNNNQEVDSGDATGTDDNKDKATDENKDALAEGDTTKDATEETEPVAEDLAIASVPETSKAMLRDSSVIEDALNTVVVLEALSDVLKNHMKKGGVDKAGLLAANILIKSEKKRHGVIHNDLSISQENFGMSDKINATKIALENATEFILRVWQAILQAIKQFANWLFGFSKGMGTYYEETKKEVDKLEEVLSEAKNDTIQTDKKYMNSNNISKMIIAPNVPFNASLSCRIISSYAAPLYAFLERSYKASVEKMEQGLDNKDIEQFDHDIKVPIKFPPRFVQGGVKGYEPSEKDMIAWRFTDPLPGQIIPLFHFVDYAAIDKYPDAQQGDKAFFAALRNTRFYLANISNGAAPNELEYMVNKSELESSLKDLGKLVEQIKGCEKVFNAFANSYKKLSDKIKKFLDETKSSGNDGPSRALSDELTGINKFIHAAYIAPGLKTSQHLNATIDAIKDYLGQNIKLFV